MFSWMCWIWVAYGTFQWKSLMWKMEIWAWYSGEEAALELCKRWPTGGGWNHGIVDITPGKSIEQEEGPEQKLGWRLPLEGERRDAGGRAKGQRKDKDQIKKSGRLWRPLCWRLWEGTSRMAGQCQLLQRVWVEGRSQRATWSGSWTSSVSQWAARIEAKEQPPAPFVVTNRRVFWPFSTSFFQIIANGSKWF